MCCSCSQRVITPPFTHCSHACSGVIGKVDETLFTYAETPEQAWEQCVKGGVMTRWLQEQHTT